MGISQFLDFEHKLIVHMFSIVWGYIRKKDTNASVTNPHRKIARSCITNEHDHKHCKKQNKCFKNSMMSFVRKYVFPSFKIIAVIHSYMIYGNFEDLTGYISGYMLG